MNRTSKITLLFGAIFWLVAAAWLWLGAPLSGKLVGAAWFAVSFVSPAGFYYSLIPALALFGNNPGGPHHLYLLELALMGLVARHLIDRATGRVQRRRCRLDPWVTLFVAWSWLCLLPQAQFLYVELSHVRLGFLFAIFSHYVDSPTYGLECALKLTLAAGMYAQLRDRPWTSHQIANWLAVSLAAVAVTAVAGLGNYFGMIPLEWWRGQNVDILRFGYPRLQSVYWHSGWYAQYVEAFAPAAMAMAWFSAGRRRTGGWALLGLLALVTFLSMQRAGWLGFAAGCSVIATGASWMTRKNTRAWGPIAFRIAAVLGLLLVLAFVLAISSRNFNNRLHELTTYQHRTFIWAGAAGMIKPHPMTGVGLGNYLQQHLVLYPAGHPLGLIERSFKTTAHDLYLHVAAERGLIGLGLLLAIMIGAGRLLVAKMSAIKASGFYASYNGIVVLAIAGGLAALAIDGIFQYTFYVRTIEVAFWLMIGWTASFDETPPRPWRLGVWLLIFLAAGSIHAIEHHGLLRPWTQPVNGDQYIIGGRKVKIELPRKAERVRLKLATIDPGNQSTPVTYKIRLGQRVLAEDTFATQTARTYVLDVGKSSKRRRLVVTASRTWSPFGFGLRSPPVRRIGVLYQPPEPVKKP